MQGRNISKDEMNFTSEEIVERFVRGDKARHEQGSGLGLAIVKSYTEIQNGTFNISIDGDLFKTTLTFKIGSYEEVYCTGSSAYARFHSGFFPVWS